MPSNTAARPATREDAVFLSGRLRAADIKELYAASGLEPLEALLQGLELSVPHAWALEDEQTGEPYLMGGVRPVGDGFGLVWALASDAVERHSATMRREAKRMLLRIRASGEYRVISNAVHADNHKAIRWLERLGFTFVHRDVPVGEGCEPFHSFAMNMGRAV